LQFEGNNLSVAGSENTELPAPAKTIAAWIRRLNKLKQIEVVISGAALCHRISKYLASLLSTIYLLRVCLAFVIERGTSSMSNL